MDKRTQSRRAVRKRRLQKQALAAGSLGLTAAIAIAGILLWKKNLSEAAEDTTGHPLVTIEQESESGTAAVSREETVGQRAEAFVEGVDISGLTRQEAEAKLKEAYSGPLQVSDGEETVELDNPVDSEIARLLDEVYETPGEEKRFSFDRERMREDLQAQAASLAAKWDRKPEDSRLVAFHKDSGAYEYSREKNGRSLDQGQLVEALVSQAESRGYETVQAVFAETPASRSQAQTKEAYRVIGSFTTKLTSNKNRNQNVKLAADAIDGKVLQPGEEFSFNDTTGNRTSEKGYQPAGAYRNGILIEEPGGGVCQVSTTLYHAVIESGFKTTERNAHSFAPSYVEKGQDAMVSFDGYAGPDLKFKNSSSEPVVLRASVEDLTLKLSVVGIPVLENGMEVTIRSEKVRDVDPPVPVYEEDPSLPFGTEQVAEQAQGGSVWKSYRVYKKDGQTVKEEPLHNSSYKGKPARIRRNTAVMTETDPTAAPGTGETAAPGTDGTATPGTDGTAAPGTDGTAVPGTDGTVAPEASGPSAPAAQPQPGDMPDGIPGGISRDSGPMPEGEILQTAPGTRS